MNLSQNTSLTTGDSDEKSPLQNATFTTSDSDEDSDKATIEKKRLPDSDDEVGSSIRKRIRNSDQNGHDFEPRQV